MSLINEALKRAKQAQNRPPAAPANPATMQPVDTALPAGIPLSLLVASAALMGILILGAGFILLGRSPAPTAPLQAAESLIPSATPALLEMPPVFTQEAPAQLPAPIASDPVDRAAMAPSSSWPAEIPGPVPQFASASLVQMVEQPLPELAMTSPPLPNQAVSDPALKLQGIFFRLSNPSVMINGEVLFQGDTIDGARVIRIERNSVIVQTEKGTETLRVTR
jgi:hypothetical protein